MSRQDTVNSTPTSEARPDPSVLWARYHATGDVADRNALLLAYEGLVRTVVGRLPAAVLEDFACVDATRRSDRL